MRMVLVSSRCSSRSGVSSSISADARQPFSGVRTSWHIRLMNSLFASFAARSRMTTSARCAACTARPTPSSPPRAPFAYGENMHGGHA